MSEAEFGFRGKMTCLGIEFGNIYVVSTIEPDMIKICLAVVITEDKRVKRAYTTVDRADIIVGVRAENIVAVSYGALFVGTISADIRVAILEKLRCPEPFCSKYTLALIQNHGIGTRIIPMTEVGTLEHGEAHAGCIFCARHIEFAIFSKNGRIGKVNLALTC